MTTTTSSPSMSSSAALQCNHCGRSFTRREHLERHIRIHTRERPFKCSECGKCYARRDVYVRHVRSHGPEVASRQSLRQALHVACDACHKRKVKCLSSEIPCRRCKDANLVCTFRDREAPSQVSGAPSPLGQPSSIADGQEVHGPPLNEEQNPPQESSLDPTLLSDPGALQDDEQIFVNPFMPGPGTSHLVEPNFSSVALFEDDPFANLFHNNTFHDLPQVADGFYADLSTIYDFLSAEYGSTSWADSLHGPSESLQDSCVVDLPDLEMEGMESSSQPATASPHQQKLADAYAKLNEYSTTHQPTRPSSPQSANTHRQYMHELGRISPVDCGRSVMDVFIGLFQVHIAPTFPCFRGLYPNFATQEEVCLAMAAVGGLYCQMPKSEIVAKWLLHKSRRRLLTTVHSTDPGDLSINRLAILQTYILMEIFSFICGDKRMLLLLDVYHAQMVQEFHAFLGERSTLDNNTQLLADAVHVLECYRVVLLQRPTMLYATTLLGRAFYIPGNATERSAGLGQDLSNLLRAMTTWETASVQINSTEQSMQSLCALSVVASNCQRLPRSLSRFHSTRHDSRQDFLELSLQRWLALHTEGPSAGTWLLYHLLHLSTYCTLIDIERMARSAKASTDMRGMVDRPAAVSDDAVDPRAAACRQSEFKCFTNNDHRKKAVWHATRILEIAPSIEIAVASSSETRVHLRHLAEAGQCMEPVHLSHAVYIACMVLWASTWLERDEHSQNSIGLADSVLQKGSKLLSHSASQTAKVFKHVLETVQAAHS